MFYDVVNRLLECVSTRSIQSLNNEGIRYDKYHPYPTAYKNGWFGLSFGLWRRIIKTNLRAKQQSGKRHHYEESVEKATKKKLSVQGLGDEAYDLLLPHV